MLNLACITSIIRIPYLILLIHSEDYAYEKIKGVMWATAELALAITCSCLPVTPRLFQHLLAITPGNSGNSLFIKAVGDFSPTKGPEDGIKGNWVALDEIKKLVAPEWYICHRKIS